MVVVSTVVPYFLLNEGIRQIGGSQASIIAMLGPPLTVGVGWITLDESLSWWQLCGTAAVLAGVFLAQKPTSRPTKAGADDNRSRVCGLVPCGTPGRG